MADGSYEDAKRRPHPLSPLYVFLSLRLLWFFFWIIQIGCSSMSLSLSVCDVPLVSQDASGAALLLRLKRLSGMIYRHVMP